MGNRNFPVLWQKSGFSFCDSWFWTQRKTGYIVQVISNHLGNRYSTHLGVSLRKIPGRINWEGNLHKIQRWRWREDKPVLASWPVPFSGLPSQPYSEQISPATGSWPPMYCPLLQGFKPPVTHSSETVNPVVFLSCFCLVFCYICKSYHFLSWMKFPREPKNKEELPFIQISKTWKYFRALSNTMLFTSACLIIWPYLWNYYFNLGCPLNKNGSCTRFDPQSASWYSSPAIDLTRSFIFTIGLSL